MFVDRDEELSWLEEKWRSGRAELLLLYGRRRIGKTELVRRFADGKRIAYFMCEEVEEQSLVEELSRELARFFDDPLLSEHPFTSWRHVFTYLARRASEERVGLVLDEFQYAARVSKGLLSVLQASWDERLRSTKAFLLLMGSAGSFAEGVLSEKNPLYGRITGYMKLEQLSPLYLREFAPSWKAEDLVRLYAVFGGVPGYLVEIDSSRDLWSNLRSLVLSRRARFLDEAKHLLKEELREVHRYFTVLEAIARGATTYGEISSKSRVSSEALSKYLSVLEDMGIVEKRYPILGAGRARYYVRDHFLRFWFRYIPRYRSAIELGFESEVLEAVRRDLDSSLTPLAWEEVVKEIVIAKARSGELDVIPTRVGSWWHREDEIDVVVLDDVNDRAVLVEAKWSELSAREARVALDRLRARASRIPWRGEKRYILAAKEVHGNPCLLPDEALVTLKDYEEALEER